MAQRMVTLTIDKVGSKDLIRQKMEFIRLMDQVEKVRRRAAMGRKASRLRDPGERTYERLEGLLCFLDACTDQIKDGKAIAEDVGPENWEDKT